MTEDVIKELASTLNTWTFDFNTYQTDRYFKDFSGQLNDDDFLHLMAIMSFLLLHEIGHMLYNVYIKDSYGMDIQCSNSEFYNIENLASSIFASEPCLSPKNKEQKENWYEEFFCDSFALEYCVKLVGGYSKGQPLILPLFGLSFNSLLMMLNEAY